MRVPFDRTVEVGEIVAGVIGVTRSEDGLNSFQGFGNSLPMTMTTNHHRALSRKFLRVNYFLVGKLLKAPAQAREEVRGSVSVRCSWTMTSTTRDSQLRNLSGKLARGKIHMRLRFHVMAKDTVGVPLSGVLEIVFAVRIEKGSVEMHPAAVH